MRDEVGGHEEERHEKDRKGKVKVLSDPRNMTPFLSTIYYTEEGVRLLG